MSCTNCGSAFHEKWNCPKPLERRGASKDAEHQAQSAEASEPAGRTAEVKSGSPDPHKLSRAQAALVAAELTSRGTPRQRAPKGTFDRKAYQREKARERRAKAKLQ